LKSHITLVLAGASLVLGLGSAHAVAQDENALRTFFEGKKVTLKIDMPGSSDGIDVRVDRPFDLKQANDRVSKFGAAIKKGDRATVTLVKLKKDLIEFHLDGGGFGTFGDDTSTSVNMPLIEKTQREKDLENLAKSEPDVTKRRLFQDILDQIRIARDRENEHIKKEKAIADESKRAEVAAKRLAGGSRFNLRYNGSVPATLKPQDVVAALTPYVDFSGGKERAPQPI